MRREPTPLFYSSRDPEPLAPARHAGMLAWGFESEAERLVAIREARERAKKAAALAGLQYREPESRSQESSSDEDIVPDAYVMRRGGGCCMLRWMGGWGDWALGFWGEGGEARV